MPACRTEGGGDVVPKRRAVMERTGGRSARKATDGSRPPKSESAKVGRPCSPAQRGTFRNGLCRAHERDRYGVEHPSEERVRKAVCRESGPHGLEQGKGVSPTYCYIPTIVATAMEFERR